MRRALWIGSFAAAVSLFGLALFLVPTLWGKPWSIEHLYLRVFLETALRHPMLLSQLRVLEPYGIRSHNRKLDDFSLAAEREEAEALREDLATLRSYPREAQSPSQQLSSDVLGWFLEINTEGEPFLLHDYPLNQLDGIQVALPDFLLNVHPQHDARDAEDYVARLALVGAAIDRIDGTRARRGGIAPPRFVALRVKEQVETLGGRRGGQRAVTGSPSSSRATQLTRGASCAARAARTEVERGVLPAWGRLASSSPGIVAERLEAPRGLALLPLGAPLSHHLEPKRGRDPRDRAARGRAHPRGDPRDPRGRGHRRRRPRGDAARLAARGALPHSRHRGRSRPGGAGLPGDRRRNRGAAARALRATAARAGDRRAGTFVQGEGCAGRLLHAAAARRLEAWDFLRKSAQHSRDPEARHAHARLPRGHPGPSPADRDRAGADGPPDLPPRAAFTAFIEGWALYAERLALEQGFHPTPYDRIGALIAEVFRAVRLVVDTGLHAKRWSREEAIAYMAKNTGLPESDVVAEIERYVVSPGQACAYKIGQLGILELRERAARALGPRFELRAFHDFVLGSGALPLELLERQADA
jgi:hypothetical protein